MHKCKVKNSPCIYVLAETDHHQNLLKCAARFGKGVERLGRLGGARVARSGGRVTKAADASDVPEDHVRSVRGGLSSHERAGAIGTALALQVVKVGGSGRVGIGGSVDEVDGGIGLALGALDAPEQSFLARVVAEAALLGSEVGPVVTYGREARRRKKESGYVSQLFVARNEGGCTYQATSRSSSCRPRRRGGCGRRPCCRPSRR